MKRLVVLVAVMSVSGCECLFGGYGPGFPIGGTGGGFVAPALVDGGELVAAHQQCSITPEQLSPDALLATPRGPAVNDGFVETPLSPGGCFVRLDEYRAGRRVGVSIRQYFGFLVPVDATQQTYTDKVAVYLDVSLAADGSVHALMDLDGDGTRDADITEIRSNGVLHSRTATRYDSGNGNVIHRETMAISDLDHQHFKVEDLVAGALTVVTEFDAPTRQRQTLSCYQPRPAGTSDTVPCGKSDAALRQLVHAALTSYASCLSGYGTFTFARFEAFMLDDVKANEMNIECFRDSNYFGEAQSANDTLRLNVDMVSGCENSTFSTSTIVHEMLHFTRGPHEVEKPAGPYGPRAAAYSDPMRACEELCYGTIKDRCTCARCLGTKACDSRCSSLPSCVFRPDGGAATMSEAVGAHCPGTNTWYSTMAACNSASCTNAAGESTCKSYSVSCNKNCQ